MYVFLRPLVSCCLYTAIICSDDFRIKTGKQWSQTSFHAIIYIYIKTDIYFLLYIYIYRERERDVLNTKYKPI